MDRDPGHPMRLEPRRPPRRWMALALGPLLLAGPLVAQSAEDGAPWSAPAVSTPAAPTAAPTPPSPRPRVELGLVSGGAAFSALRSQLVTARILEGEHTGERSFERLIAPESSTAAALLATWWLSPRWGVRVAAAYAASALSIRLEERDRRFLEREGAGDESSYADLAVWLAEASLLVAVRPPVRRVQPYLVLGGGVVLYDPDESYGEPMPVGIREVMAEQSRKAQPALVVGAGARIPLEPGPLALTFELTDHVTLSPFDRTEPAIVERDGLRLELDAPSEDPPGTRVVNHIRFAAGVSIPLWR